MTDNFFGGAPGLSWPKANNGAYTDTRLLGVARGGLIVDDPTVQVMTDMQTQATLYWDAERTRPKQQMVVTLLCDGRGPGQDERDGDDGRRRLYIRSGLVKAVREALQKVGATGLRQGGELYVAWIGEKPAQKKGNDPARVWAAQYIPPAVGLPDSGGPAGAPSSNPFGGPVVTGAPAQQQQPADPWGGPQAPGPAGPPANPFGGAGYQPQTAPVGAPPANPFG
jgi:hypothetical protein